MSNKNFSASESKRRLAEYKRRAKEMRRRGVGSHLACLSQIAREEGHAGWWALLQSLKVGGPSGPTRIRFMMDSKDAEGVDDLTLEASFKRIPNFNPDNLDWDSDELRDRTWEEYFLFVGTLPSTVEEAVDRIREVFFFPPARLWFDEHEVEPYVEEVSPGVRRTGGHYRILLD